MKISDTLTDDAIVQEIGRRLERARLDRNLTQKQLAKMAGVSLSSVIRIEQGRAGTVDNFLRLLRALRLLDGLEQLVPEAVPGPIELADTRRHAGRRRATPERHRETTIAKPFVWGDKR